MLPTICLLSLLFIPTFAVPLPLGLLPGPGSHRQLPLQLSAAAEDGALQQGTHEPAVVSLLLLAPDGIKQPV